MNKAKKNLELISAIASITAGTFIVIACVLSIITIKNFDRDYFTGVAIAFLIFEIIYASVITTFGALLFFIPYKDGNFKKRKAFTIVLVVLFSILTFWYHISMLTVFTPLAVVMICVCIANVAVTSTAMNFEPDK